MENVKKPSLLKLNKSEKECGVSVLAPCSCVNEDDSRREGSRVGGEPY